MSQANEAHEARQLRRIERDTADGQRAFDADDAALQALFAAIDRNAPADEIEQLRAAADAASDELESVCHRALKGAYRWHAQLARPPREPRAPRRIPGTAPPIDGREQARRQSPGEKRGPPPPELETLATELTRTLVALLTQMVATQTERDDWISQRQPHAVPARIRCKLCRDLVSRGDDRAAILGRDHLLRRSAIDEYLKGLPRPAPAATQPQPIETPVDPGMALERKLRLIGAWR